MKPQANGEMFVVAQRETIPTGAITEGTFMANDCYIRIMFDFGSMYLFSARNFMLFMGLRLERMLIPLEIFTRMGLYNILDIFCHRTRVRFDGLSFLTDPVVLVLFDFYIIYGMGLTTSYRV